MRILTSGTEEINMKELEESTSYEGGYTPETTIIKYPSIHSDNCGTCCTV